GSVVLMPLSPREVELGFWHPKISGELTGEGWLKRYIEPEPESDRADRVAPAIRANQDAPSPRHRQPSCGGGELVSRAGEAAAARTSTHGGVVAGGGRRVRAQAAADVEVARQSQCRRIVRGRR